MELHPVNSLYYARIKGLAILLFGMVILFLLSELYTDFSFTTNAVSSFIYTSIVGLAGYSYWYVYSFFQSLSARFLIAFIIQLIALGAVMICLFILGENHDQLFLSIPLFLLTGSMGWIMLEQWYFWKRVDKEGKKEILPVEEASNDCVDRITVKEGGGIHIIHVEDLYYIQAYGDYVLFFTANGKHVKEQTMKYYETHLPSCFVRIHRSFIVNTEQIGRVELFGKENYRIRLKNGTSVRASANGYKLLKKKLSL
jgi:hypothetical protein